MAKLPWFRFYTEAVDDEKLRLLAFEDRWHYVAILCCKGQGILETEDHTMLNRKMAVKLGVQMRELDEIRRRLMEVDLVDEHFQPTGWDERQFLSDTSTDRVRKYRKKSKKTKTSKSETEVKRYNAVSETAPDTDTDTDTESEKEKETALGQDIFDSDPEHRRYRFKKAISIPDDIALNAPMRQHAGKHGLQGQALDDEFEMFCAHHQKNRTNPKNKFSDWEAAWRTWVGNWKKYKQQDGHTAGVNPLTVGAI